jgi:hypothetical protein
MDVSKPQYEYLDARDIYGSVLVRRIDSTNELVIPELGPAEDLDPPETDVTPQAQVIDDIRVLTELSWPRIARLIGVERQTVYRWRNGEAADEQCLRRAVNVLDVLVEAREEHGNGRDLRAWLNRTAPLQRASPYQLLMEGQFDQARFLAMLAPSRVGSISDLARDTEKWDRHLAEEERSYVD